MGKSVTWTGACANEIISNQKINRSFVYKAKEGRNVRITNKSVVLNKSFISLSKLPYYIDRDYLEVSYSY